MPVTDKDIKEIVHYLFLHKWLAIPYSEANAKLLEDAIKGSINNNDDDNEESK